MCEVPLQCKHGHAVFSCCRVQIKVRDWYFIAEKTAPATHLAHPDGCAASIQQDVLPYALW
jgi:hypothetical protein